ncbi:MAG: Hsp20/alpha crystallin family protein [Deltaproteobacteria bacterium]|nr:Hsp20/alpha crystallin family protein [Deltaproteobacteria bacterium]MBW2017433.1 Hsp20/alpha crystallin family protein [Deltaproteobacteria bacterium]MBW2129585.1 Hsp20/alpha crystallin family protein [Deltaproteobacteria bacterium]MBW2303423.1 Hsp20/alpha crystallin family protein [Deltaproteobacteria bacterium]
MDLVKWNPWREMETLSDRINQLFSGPLFPSQWFGDESMLEGWKPAVDIMDKGDKIVIKAELPGVDKKDIRVELKDNILTLEGERASENEVQEDRYYRKERFFGKFSRSFVVPKGLDPDKVKADYKDGVLNIEIPKPEEEKARKITVH